MTSEKSYANNEIMGIKKIRSQNEIENIKKVKVLRSGGESVLCGHEVILEVVRGPEVTGLP